MPFKINGHRSSYTARWHGDCGRWSHRVETSPLQASLSSVCYTPWRHGRKRSEAYLIFVAFYTGKFLGSKMLQQKHWERKNSDTGRQHGRKWSERLLGFVSDESDVWQWNKYREMVTPSNTGGSGQKWLRHSCSWKPLGRAHNRVEATTN